MKRVLAVGMVLLTTVFLLSGCGAKEKGDSHYYDMFTKMYQKAYDDILKEDKEYQEDMLEDFVKPDELKNDDIRIYSYGDTYGVKVVQDYKNYYFGFNDEKLEDMSEYQYSGAKKNGDLVYSRGEILKDTDAN